ncbi:oligoribonuclease [Pseudomonas putida]|uniref:Oligoribonuclease n=1 Tax=Pseudomonas putida TaxID=303 RepID=A0A8I1EBT7_PSEPU|nr:oligoribonuclease [Pseudomonas putida]MBI6882403.1 oligoribonuclease [Pseudomonas putida]
MQNKNLAWLDLETTGFTELDKKSVYKHKILEIGLIVTDSNFRPIATLNQVIHHDLEEIVPICDDVVKQMHTKNGLFDEVVRSAITLEMAEKAVIDFLIQHGVDRKASPMCGSGIQFDRMFTEAQMPALNDHLHYRNLDVSAVKEFIKTIVPGLEPKKRLAHRAIDDIQETLAEARHYRGIMKPALEAARKAFLEESGPSL